MNTFSQISLSARTVFLIPTPIIPDLLHSLPPNVIQVLHMLRHFIVENARTARRFIKSTNPPYEITELYITELDKHHSDHQPQLLSPLLEGHDIGIMSEAGCPGIADPGSILVLEAHRMGVRVVPLTGPSSLVLALMASGLNGQRFQFHGYLTPKKDRIGSDLRRLEEISRKDQATQIFIETPYRNQQVIEAALMALAPTTLFCIATELTGESEYIRTLSIQEWRGIALPDLQKRPTVFCLATPTAILHA